MCQRHGIAPDTRCPACGLPYRALRTGLKYCQVVDMLKAGDDAPRHKWRNLRRHGVLGFWHALKIDCWHAHLRDCQADPLPF